MAPGQTIAGRYVVTAHLGSGGMGDVFEVEHTLLGKRFALKRLSADMTTDRDMVERFLREARAAAATRRCGWSARASSTPPAIRRPRSTGSIA